MIDKVLALFHNEVVCCDGVWDYLFINMASSPKKYLVYNTSFDQDDVYCLTVTNNEKLMITIKK